MNLIISVKHFNQAYSDFYNYQIENYRVNANQNRAILRPIPEKVTNNI